MAKLDIAPGTISKKIRVFIQDSSKTAGEGLTGLVFGSAGLVAYYLRDGAAAPVAITLATAVIGTWSTGGFKEVSAANMPGVYELGVPNTVLAVGSDDVSIMLHGAANMAPVILEIQLVAPGGGTVDANIVSISGDAAAADNLEADYDNTGYVKANSTIGVCTLNTDQRGTNNAALAANAFNPSANVLENGKTYDEIWRIDHASVSGLLTRVGDVLTFKSDDGSTTRMTVTVDGNNNRILVITSGV